MAEKTGCMFPQGTWQEEWKNMPEFVQEDATPYQKIVINFETIEDVNAFAELLKCALTPQTNTLWFPIKVRVFGGKRYVDRHDVEPSAPAAEQPPTDSVDTETKETTLGKEVASAPAKEDAATEPEPPQDNTVFEETEEVFDEEGIEYND